MLVAKFIQEIFLLENFLQETFANALKGHQSKCQVKAVTTLYLVQHNIKSDIELTRSQTKSESSGSLYDEQWICRVDRVLLDDSVENVITVRHMFAHLRCKGFGQSPARYSSNVSLELRRSLFSLQDFLKIYKAENGEVCHMNTNELNLYFKVQDLPNATTH